MTVHRLYYAHGKGTGPWGTKIQALAPVAEAFGFRVESIDFTHTDDPEERLAHARAQNLSADGRLVLVGSSMGGHVFSRLAEMMPVDGLFLLAPAIGIPGYPGEPQPDVDQHEVVHGWEDAVVPVEAAIGYARRCRARLHVLDSGHDLNDRIPLLEELLAAHLRRVLAGE